MTRNNCRPAACRCLNRQACPRAWQRCPGATSTRVVAHEVVRDRTLASIFQRPSNAAFLRLLRVRLADNVPMSREVAWYDLSAAPALEFWDTSGSAYEFLLEKCQPVYETVPGWQTPITTARKLSDLPTAARKYVDRLSELLALPVGFVSVGPDREQTIGG